MVANLGFILVLNESCCGVICIRHGWVSLTDAVMCINLINEFLLGIVISYVIFESLGFSIVQTQLHFICLTGNFWKGVDRLN